MALSGHLSAFFINSTELSAGLTGMSGVIEVAELDTTAMGDNDQTRIAGLYNGTMAVNGMWDDDAAGMDTLIQSLVGTSDIEVTALLGLRAQGAAAFFGQGTLLRYPFDAPLDGLLAGSFDMAFDGQSLGRGLAPGFCIDYQTAVTASGNSATSVDYGVNAGGVADPNSNLGGLSMLHVFGARADSTLTVSVEDSTNDAAWATFDTFAAVTAVGQELIVSGATDQVDRYTRLAWTVADGVAPSGNWRFVVSFFRRVVS